MSSVAPKRLTTRQTRFIEVYAGNGTQAAREAGYSGNDNTLAQTARGLLRNPQIAAAIRKREQAQTKKLIATREERQQFWTEVMKKKNEKVMARLKASELLGRSQADFTDVVEHEVGKSLEDLVRESLKKPPEPEEPK